MRYSISLIKKTKRIIIINIIIIFLAVPASLALEIENLDNVKAEGNFILSPSKIEILIDPGESLTKNLSILNKTGKSLNVFIDIEDFTGDTISSSKLLGDEKGPYSLKNYIRPEKDSFIIEHGQKAILPVTIKIPETSEPGGLYGAVIFRAESELNKKKDKERDGQVAINTRLATLFFVRVKGDIEFLGNLKSFTIVNKNYQEEPMDFSIIYENKGSVHLNPYGMFELRNIIGKKIDEIEINPYFVMPGFSREKIITLNKKITFGRYTASLKLNRGYNDIIDEDEFSFWILNTKILIIGFVVVLIAIIFIWIFIRRFKKRKLYEGKKEN